VSTHRSSGRGGSHRLVGTTDLMRLPVAMASIDHTAAGDLLSATPLLATAGLPDATEFFLAGRLAHVYQGGSASHAA